METRVKSTSIRVAAVLTLAASTSLADSSRTAVLTVRVSQLRSNDGQVGCMLYASEKGFPTDPSAAAQKRWCAVADRVSTCLFDPIAAGTYAVACFHDQNKNGKLDRGLFGIPTEDTVASNHAKGFMGPPSFDKAKFTFPGIAATLDLRMNAER
jgi:uncharacterized protein (DUF2141 family)